jgi:predicted Rossmann-fold nucleotide-binding protein
VTSPWAQLNRHAKPILIADIGGYWRPLLLLFAHMNEKGLIRQGFELRYLVAEKIEHVVPMLRAAERKIAIGPLLSVHFSPKISATYSQLTRLSMTAFR